MIQANKLPLCEVLDSSLFAEAFQEDNVVFGTADEDVFTPAITLWAMISQFLFKRDGRSCKAAAGRVVSLIAQIAGRVVAQNAGTIATTLLDVEEHPGAWLGSMYEGRWIVEPDIESIKCTLGLENLRGQSPESLHRELWTGVPTYNLVRLKMLQSGYAAGREIRSMSFTETHQLLATNWLLCACVGVSEAMAVSAQQQGTCAVIGQRPDRVEPRENKRRPKVLKLLTVARRMFHAALAAITKTP